MSFNSTQIKIKNFLKNADDKLNHLYYFGSNMLKDIIDFIPKDLNFYNKNVIELGIGGGYFASYLFTTYQINNYTGLDANLKSLNISHQKLLFWKKKISLIELNSEDDYHFNKYYSPNSIFLCFVCIQQFPDQNYTETVFNHLNNSGIEELFFQTRENKDTHLPIFFNDYNINFKTNNYLTKDWISSILTNYNLSSFQKSNSKNQYIYFYFTIKKNNNNNQLILQTNSSNHNILSNQTIIHTNHPQEIIIPKSTIINKDINIENTEEITNFDKKLNDIFSIPFIHYSLSNSGNKFDKLLKIAYHTCKTKYIFFTAGQQPSHHNTLIATLDTPILVIGNSPSVKDYELGDIIDKFPIVIRINDWVTKKFEKNIGSKTDIWVSGASYQAQILKRDPDTYKKLITFIADTGMGIFHKVKQSKVRLRINKLSAVLDADNIIFGYRSIGGRHCLTTGSLLLLVLCALEYQKIYIHGINLDYKGRNQRYFSNRILSTDHNLHMERDFLDYIVNRCNIKRLTEIFPETKIENQNDE